MQLEIGRGATLRVGRWAWIGHGCKIRVHEGEVEIGAKTVMGQECTISAFQHVSIGRECILADRVMLIDFDHGVTEVERPIRLQGIYKRDVRVGHNVWIGYGACVLRGVSVGDNSIVGTNAVVTKDVPDERRRRRRARARDPHARRPRDDALGMNAAVSYGRTADAQADFWSESCAPCSTRARGAHLRRRRRQRCVFPVVRLVVLLAADVADAPRPRRAGRQLGLEVGLRIRCAA